MKKVLISLTVALMLVMLMAAPAMAVEQTKTASVTVNSYISFTVTDNGAAGVNFGSLDPGATDQPESAQSAIEGALQLTVGSETNQDVTISLKGTDFSDGINTMLVSNVKYDDDNSPNEGGSDTGKTEGAMSTTYASWYGVNAGSGDTTECYHWISIPSAQDPGTYTSTFYYQCA